MRALRRVALLPVLTSLALVAQIGAARAADPGVLVCAVVETAAGHVSYCDFYDPAYDVVRYATCTEGHVRGVPAPGDPLNSNQYMFTGALLGGRYVAWSATYCRIGSALGLETHEGNYGYMSQGFATGPLEEQYLPICTQWAVRFAPGDPHGHDPNLIYWTDEYCH